jgi:hypothetical protein
MIFFFWRGKGYIVFIGIVCTILLTALVAGALLGFEDATMPTYVIEFSIGSLLFVPIWFYGRKWNKEAYTFTHRGYYLAASVTINFSHGWITIDIFFIRKHYSNLALVSLRC